MFIGSFLLQPYRNCSEPGTHSTLKCGIYLDF